MSIIMGGTRRSGLLHILSLGFVTSVQTNIFQDLHYAPQLKQFHASGDGLQGVPVLLLSL